MEVRVKSEKEELLDKKIEEVRKRNEARLKKFQVRFRWDSRSFHANKLINLILYNSV